MTDEKITIEQLRQMKLRGDPLGVVRDPELQLTAIEVARKTYEASRTDKDFDQWIAVIAATIDLGTRVSALAEYLSVLNKLYEARAQNDAPLNEVQENGFARQLGDLWGILDERDQRMVEEVTDRFKSRS